MKRIFVVLVGIVVVVVLVGVLVVRSWTITDHGKLDTRAAIVLKLNQLTSNPDYKSIADKRDKLEKGARISAGTTVPVWDVKDIEIPGPASDIPIRIYTPDGFKRMPIIVFYHGGGWVAGSLNTHDNTCRILAKEAEAMVISVAYRLAPEYPFPAGVEDAYAAIRWIQKNAGVWGGDTTRIAVAGDSAGGSMAAIVTQMAKSNDGPDIAAQVLIYPATDFSNFDTVSHQQNASGFMLLRKNMEMYRAMYLPQPKDWHDPKASPLLARDFKGLPPAIVITSEFDPLRDEGEAYAEKLKQAGVPTVAIRYRGLVHGFIGMRRFLPQADEATSRIGKFLKIRFLQ